MGQIRIDTERVSAVGQHLLAEAQQLQETSMRLNNEINSLDTWAWDGLSRSRAEPLLSQIQPETKHWVQELQRLGQMLQHIARTFQDQDHAAAQNFGVMKWVDFKPQQVSTGGGRSDQETRMYYEGMSEGDRLSRYQELQNNVERVGKDLEQAKNELSLFNQAYQDELGDLDIERVQEYLAYLDQLEQESTANIAEMQHPGRPIEWLINLVSDADDKYISTNQEMISKIKNEFRPRWQQRLELLQQRQELENRVVSLEQQFSDAQREHQILRQVIVANPLSESTHPLAQTTNSESCVWYARGRRPDLGAAGGSAENYINNYHDTVYQLNSEQIEDPLQFSGIRPGHAVVWEAGVQSAHPVDGHVAIVEEVHADYIVVSEANWGGHGIKTREIPRDSLGELYFVP